MKAHEFIAEVITPKFAPFVTLLDWLESANVHQRIGPDQEVPEDNDEHTLFFKLDEWPGGTPKAVIDQVVNTAYRGYAKIVLSAVRKGVFAPMRPNDPLPDDIDMGGPLEVFIRLES